MNESASQSSSGSFAWQFAGILVAAFALGLAYNSLSPLRVRETLATETGAGPVGSVSIKPASVRTGLHNETLSLTLEPPAVIAPPVVNQAVPPPPPIGVLSPVIPALKWPEVKTLLDAGKIVLIDARLQASYDLGHIPGAILLPATSSVEVLRAFAEKYPKNTALVTYCGSDTCDMSHQLAELLIRICGFTNVRHMPGGYAEYMIAITQGQ